MDRRRGAGLLRPVHCPDRFIALAHRLADAAGAVIRPHFRAPLTIERKADRSPVTIADRDAERAIRQLIATAQPDHGITGEEFEAVKADAEYVWIIDPIDGTKAFITGLPVFGTLIALAHEGRAILGVIDQPISGERWVGAIGHPCRLDGAPAHTRTGIALADAVLYTTGPEHLRGACGFERSRDAVRLTRYGVDCYATGLLACGLVDLVIERGLKVYDYMALIAVVEAAGGIITDWRGRPLDLTSDGTLLAAGDSALHRAALALLSV